MGDEAETRVVKTYPLFGFWFVHRIAGHVLAIRAATEGRQGAPLLEHCRKPALCGRSGGAAPGSVSGRDQRQPARGVVPGDRSVRRGERAASAARACFRPSGRCRIMPRGFGVQVRLDAMELHRPRQWGACWLACHLYEQLQLDRFFAPLLPSSREGTSWRAHPADAGVLSADRSRQRMAAASAVVRSKRDGGFAGRGLWAGRQECAVSLPR